MQLPLSPTAPLRLSAPSLSNSNHRGPLPFNFRPSFPPTGITPPHPHPVAPFPPPPPHSYGTLQHGPVSPPPVHSGPPPPLPSVHSGPPPPLPSVHSGPPPPLPVHSGPPLPVHSGPPPPLPVHSGPPPPLPVHSGPPLPVHSGPPPPLPVHSGPPQPFYSLAMTHLPPNVQPRPLPHSPYPFSPTSSPSSRGIPSSTIAHPPPYPTAIRVPITCSRCGHFMIADLSGCGLAYSPPPPPLSVASYSGASSRPHTALPLFFRHPQSLLRPQPSHPLQFTPLIQQPVSPLSFIRPAGTSCRQPSASRERPSPDTKAVSKLVKKRGTSKSQKEINLQSSVSRIIPYRERKRPLSVEVHAQQQLEVEFATVQKPTVGQMADMSQRLGVSKEFVRHWFSSRRQKQKQLKALNPVTMTIPSITHDITIEVPPVTPGDPSAEETSTVTVFTTRL